ncbi:hypothetical protein ACFYP4_26395 [Streptomyces sp. NPDC005551]|uniref:hypothetical protein n=1 Tax=Streptomyces sp. NPDC005551 TaxID=3364725 RepID=UPI0036960580
MVRNVLGSVLALLGAAAAVWSPFRAWYGGRHGRYYRVGDLFSGAGVGDARAGLFASLFLPLLAAAVLAVIGVLLRSRLLVALAGVVVLGFAVLWMVRVGQAESGLTVDSDGNGLGTGVAAALAGGALLLLGAAVMRGRRERMATLPPSERSAPPEEHRSWQSQRQEEPRSWQSPRQEEPRSWQSPPEEESRSRQSAPPEEPGSWQSGPAGEPRSSQYPPQEEPGSWQSGPADPAPDRPQPRGRGGTGAAEDEPTATWRRPPDQY